MTEIESLRAEIAELRARMGKLEQPDDHLSEKMARTIVAVLEQTKIEIVVPD
jgi:hypothetical protein